MRNIILILESLAIIWLVYKVVRLENKTKPLDESDVKVFKLETINAISKDWYEAGQKDYYSVKKSLIIIDSINKSRYFIKKINQ